MNRKIKMALLLGATAFFCPVGYAQELFVFTEPASNMPAKSIGLRMSDWLMYDKSNRSLTTQLLPEIMWGVNKNLMLHAELFAGNQSGRFRGNGAGVYGKYRLYTSDQVNRHFRIAAFGRISYNTQRIGQEEIDLTRNNSGYQAGLIATQLLHRQAMAASVGFANATNNNDSKFPASQAHQAINWSVSTGRLILPRHYTSYKQTNMNLMLEVLGQHLVGTGKSWMDIAPAVQFIFNSQTRVDIGYKYALYSNMTRTMPNGLMLRVEHLLFNAL